MSVRLTRRLVLEERGRSPDGAGGTLGGWAALGTHWGAVVPRGGRLERGEGRARARVPYRITLRAVSEASPARPRAGQRFRAGLTLFAIRAVALSQDGRFLICDVDEEVSQ